MKLKIKGFGGLEQKAVKTWGQLVKPWAEIVEDIKSQSPPNKLGGLCCEAQGQLVDQEAFMEEEKQQLGRRNTYTPASAAPARGNCDPALNREETLSVPDSKTLPNNPEEHLTDLSMSGVLSRLARVKLLTLLGSEKAIIVERARRKIEEVESGEFLHPTSRVVSFA